jgi:hypothetical protein
MTALSSCKPGSAAPDTSSQISEASRLNKSKTAEATAKPENRITAAPDSQRGTPESTPTDAEKAEPGILVLPGGSKFKTTLSKVKVIGRLRTTRKVPYFILSGVGCEDCDANISIYIHSPSDGPMKDEGGQTRFFYPGRETDHEHGNLLYEARMFFGDCVALHPNAVIWFERFLGDDRQWQPDVTFVEVKNDKLVEEHAHQDLPTINEAEDSVKRGGCQELPGMDRPNEP